MKAVSEYTKEDIVKGIARHYKMTIRHSAKKLNIHPDLISMNDYPITDITLNNAKEKALETYMVRFGQST